MPVTAAWHDEEHTIIHCEFIGKWTWDEVKPVGEQVGAMMESVTHRVDILFDVQQSGGVPLGSITQVASYTRRAAPNWGVGVFVGGGALMQALVNAYVKVFPAQRAKFTHAEDIPAALALIATRRAESAS